MAYGKITTATARSLRTRSVVKILKGTKEMLNASATGIAAGRGGMQHSPLIAHSEYVVLNKEISGSKTLKYKKRCIYAV
jgi:hypothetical protein